MIIVACFSNYEEVSLIYKRNKGYTKKDTLKKRGIFMSAVNISDIAYNEFKQVLDDNKLENYIIRINLAGMG